MARGESTKDTSPVTSLELIRDIYGFSVRPQHLERYREYVDIYKEEELERCKGWDQFLETHAELGKFEGDGDGEREGEGEGDSSLSEGVSEGESKSSDHESGGKAKKLKVEGVWKTGTWGEIRPSLRPLEQFMRRRTPSSHISSPMKYGSDVDDPEGEESFDIDRSDTARNATSQPDTPVSTSAQSVPDALVDLCPLKYELEALVRGGVPMALRGELWQIFVSTGTRRLQGHYDALLMLLADGGGESDGVGGLISGRNKSFYSLSADSRIQEKWTIQIEKDLPRTFPGHPALDESGRNILRRLLTAYARHNPEVGYCQAMNFFAALLLLLMPEENAFWTLAGIIDDYFEGYYSEKMIEAQVDQLVFEDLVQEYFPTIANHLDSLGVQVAWVSSPWFLSIFVNILPWECVLRIWDVLLYEGNRRMLFRTALALMDLHGPAIMATKDAGDAVTLLQSSAGASFDSSQLVLTACMSYQMVDEIRLQELRTNHRPTVLDSVQERAMGLKSSSDSHKGNSSELVKSDVENNLDANKNYGKGNPQIVKKDTGVHGDSRENMTPNSLHLNGFTTNIAADGVTLEAEEDTLLNPLDSEEESIGMDLAEQVKWLKSEVVRVLEENKVATVRAEELQTAFIELVKHDNRQLLTAKIEGLEEESSKLKKLLMEKEEKEQEMIQAMLQMEHMQGVAEQARIYAENDAIAQRHAAEMLQTKYENAISELEAMENRAIIAESMLAATLQYQALGKRQAASPKICTESSSLGDEKLVKPPLLGIPLSPRRDLDDSKGLSEQGAVPTVNEEQQPKQSPPQTVNHSPKPQGILSRPFSFGWFDRSKGKTAVKDTQNGLSVTPQTSISPQNSLEIQATVAENHTHAKEMETSIHEKDDAASKQDPEK